MIHTRTRRRLRVLLAPLQPHPTGILESLHAAAALHGLHDVTLTTSVRLVRVMHYGPGGPRVVATLPFDRWAAWRLDSQLSRQTPTH